MKTVYQIFFALMLACWTLCLFVAVRMKQLDPLGIPKGKYTLEYPANFGNRINIIPDNPLTKEGVYLGRMLFYEKKLSSDNKVSCATCHQQKLAFSDGKLFSVGVGKSPTTRSSMSLVNLLWGRSFFWDGRAKNLEEQVLHPITHPDEMGETLENIAKELQQTTIYPPIFKLVFGSDTITAEKISKAISQFERTLISANSKYDQYLKGSYKPTMQELKGISLFFNNKSAGSIHRGIECGHCHAGPKIQGELFHNNGLDSIPKDAGRETFTKSPLDKGRFRAVTLRNIAVTSPYMHDGRFSTLEIVLDHYSEHIHASPTLSPFLEACTDKAGKNTVHLTTQEKSELIAFLKMLTDSTFLTDPHFSDPFKQ